MHYFIFLHSTNQFLKTSQIDEVISAKLLIIEIDPNVELTRIVISVILHGPDANINPHSLYMSSAQDSSLKCTKHYLCNFFEET